MSIANRVMAMKAKPETQSSHDKPTKVKQEKEKQKQLTPAQLAAIAAVSGKDQADRLKALLNDGSKPDAIKHLADVTAPALAELTNQLPLEYALVANFINPDEKPKRKQLESQIAEWALQNPQMVK